MSRRFMLTTAIVGVFALSLTTASTEKKGNTAPSSQQNNSLEVLSSDTEIKNVAQFGSPTDIWATLEHGERVECLDCIPYIEKLLYDQDSRVREISAWWLRRRVFGYAEVANRVHGVLQSDPDPFRRAAAASAIGEFLDPGATPLLVAAVSDKDSGVRIAALAALRRMNDMTGAVAITTGLKDSEVLVRKQALETSIHLAGFTDVTTVATLLSDTDSSIRRKAADALGVFKASGSSAGLSALSKADTDEDVRVAAVNALGELGDAAGKPAVEAAFNDPSQRVRDAAHVAQLKLINAL